ncbi:hypothetical protein [Neorhizobium sp. NCHU2750]|uniref:hypothetical protein n=1 Tax=Neorhizobium sp. NCHU2750 TaxID=1825976 RepID=UPI000E73BEBB|nr:hypothetical protein NCHU2750_30560 [Neorhizobium sp. NCHU2750]
MTDFKIIDVPGMLGVQVMSLDRTGNEIPDDGQWRRHAAAAQYVLAEFLVGKSLVKSVSSIDRQPNLIIMWSQLTPTGQAFIRAAYDKWLRSVDRTDTTEATMVEKLEHRWRSFSME